ncbi:MAG: hypothetical protein C5B54_07070 [Acidobacteria bacterium]|nr:MAG: hypothetical protein C5B54_07070 [Acidobacteriota bacterium]
MSLLTRQLLAQLDQIQIASRRRMRLQHRGEKSSQRKGSSLEFSDYREYLQGDDVRSIDWSIYGRMERLYLKLFLEEESKPVSFIVDASESMSFGSPSKFQYALSLAAALSYVALRHYDRPQIILLRDQSFRRFGFGSQKQFFSMLNYLDQQTPSGETHLNAALKKIALARFKRGIYFLFSDFYSYDGFEGLKLLSSAGNELHCLQILTDEEVHPSLRGDLKLRDAEMADSAEVSISPQIVKRYLARLRALQSDIKRTAHLSFASYQTILTSLPLSSLLLRDLRRSGVVV